MGSDIARAADHEHGPALVDRYRREGLVFSIGQVQENPGQSQGRVGDDGPQKNRREIVGQKVFGGTGGDHGSKKDDRLDSAGGSAQARIDAEYAIEDKQEKRKEGERETWLEIGNGDE